VRNSSLVYPASAGSQRFCAENVTGLKQYTEAMGATHLSGAVGERSNSSEVVLEKTVEWLEVRM